MRRIYSDYAFGNGPRDGCWWDETVAAPDWPVLDRDLKVDVAIVGGGFTGISAALTLAEAGAQVAVLEANSPGWGASGRNGGFCCLGGARMSHKQMVKQCGETGAQHYLETERAATELVAARLDRYDIDADRHSDGETLLAHSDAAMEEMRADAEVLASRHKVSVKVTEATDLATQGMNGNFHGAVTIPIGFALNPRKYLFGIARAAASAGAVFFQNSPVTGIEESRDRVTLTTPNGLVHCDRVIVATNAYSSEDVPDWMAGRYLPTQSNVLVARPLSDSVLDAQGWTTGQASYDSRHLLHYFRLMPDRRFLFGSRGGMRSTPGAEFAARRRNRLHFEQMFPAWRHVESAHQWSGMVCLSRTGAPFVGAIPGTKRQYAAMCYHGNGLAMGSWAGEHLARVMLDLAQTSGIPALMQSPLVRFPLGSLRRALVPPAYLGMRWADRT
ncbi:MAG: NAD(P)/FAD-dependent oxidoreductase [Paracoccaceae bacterium]